MAEQTAKQERHPRTVRSFVKRGGRIPPGAKKALDEAWEHYGIELDSYNPDTPMLNFEALFSQSKPVILEIGFGMGHSLLAMAKANPDRNYLGVEVHEPGIARVVKEAAEQQRQNIKIARVDAVWMLQHVIPLGSLEGIQIFFPDPWHKKRHEKRRLINTEFISLANSKLVANGWVHIATDWAPYAQQVAGLFAENLDFRPIVSALRPQTKFERRGLGLGHAVQDLTYQK